MKIGQHSHALEMLQDEVGGLMATGDYLCSEIIQEKDGSTMLAIVIEQQKDQTLEKARFEKSRSETWPLQDEVWAYQLSVGLRSVVSTLRKMHSQGWVHQDVKPKNIMIPDDPDEASLTHLIDFGTARRDGAVRTAHSDTIMGTLGYILPETHGCLDVDLRIRDYWAAMVSVAYAARLIKMGKLDIHETSFELMDGTFFVTDDLLNKKSRDAFFKKNEIGGPHRGFLQWLYDFIQPNMSMSARQVFWQGNGITEFKTLSVRKKQGSEMIQTEMSDLFFNDDKFVAELEGHIRGLAEQAGIEIPDGMIESFQEFPAEAQAIEKL